ncbi:hypothetical protein ACFFTM_21170 [Pseudoduganella plicata]|uniref:Lipoprotein n=1 Tax=Pseudoduganella plicata TaxID=321984 RepID=A0AA87Y7S6_9BURK|nr:hypothetical protein [Pseudoduganella plicata]GGZ02856.1 hypothetical protein GCM10007388_40600 [Pseudoduganella plicata]
MLKPLSCALAALALTGCASITGKQLQAVTITTIHDHRELAGVGCALTNDVGTWFLTSPGSTTIHKSTADLVVHCRHDALVGNSRVESGANTAVWGNVLVGGLIGYAVDRQTGAGFDYPNAITVAMRPVGYSAIGAPADPTAPPLATAAPVGRTTATQSGTPAAVTGRTVAQ